MDFESMMEDMPKEKPKGAKGMCCGECGQPLIGKIELEVEQKDDSDDMEAMDKGYPDESDAPTSGASEEKKKLVIAMLKKKQMEG
jgi:hypothetical protein